MMNTTEMIANQVELFETEAYQEVDPKRKHKYSQYIFLKEIQQLLKDNKGLLYSLENKINETNLNISKDPDKLIQFILVTISSELERLKLNLEYNQETLDLMIIAIRSELVLFAIDLLIFIIFPHHTAIFSVFNLVLLSAFILSVATGLSLQYVVSDQTNLLDELERNTNFAPK